MTDQERARHALKRLDAVKADNREKFKKLYRSYVERLGPAILINGLGQALAMELAASGEKKKDDEQAHDRLYSNIHDLLCQAGSVYPGQTDLIEAVLNGSQDQYLAAQAETLAWLSWHKKFCQAYLPREEVRQ
jgi:CRISPR-associated protein Cmr5